MGIAIPCRSAPADCVRENRRTLMQEKDEGMIRGPGRDSLTRRQVLTAAAVAAVALNAPAVLAAPSKAVQPSRGKFGGGSSRMRRYWSASAVLGDGRILVTGGYDKPWNVVPA